MMRLFGSVRKAGDSRVQHKKTKSKDNPLHIVESTRDQDKEGKLARDIVMNDASRQTYQHEMPSSENDMGTMLRMHPRGTIFPQVAILDEPPETLEARYRRLTQLQPRINRRRMEVPDHVTVQLRKDVEEFSLEVILSLDFRSKRHDKMGYVLIKRAAFILSPLSSFIDNHSDVVVSIVDTRKRANQITRTLRLQDNKFYKGEFTLDYSFPKESAQKISLSFAQEVPTMDTGEQWAVCQIFLDLEESDFPQTVAFQETIGQAALTTSMLQEYQFHPAHLDVAIRDSHRPQLREFYTQGMIVDETEPQHDKMKSVSYAKSAGEVLKTSKNKPQGATMDENGVVDWTNIQKSVKNQIPADQVSIEPEETFDSDRMDISDELAKQPTSILKQRRSGSPHPRVGFVQLEDEDSDASGTAIRVGPLAKIRSEQ